MSSFLEEIIKLNSLSEKRDNQDLLENRIMNEFNSIEILNSDDTIRSLNENIEKWLSILRKNILEEFEEMKIVLRNASKSIIIKEIKRFENEMLQLKNCNVDYQNQMIKINEQLLSHKRNIKILSSKLSENKNKLIEARYMFNWRLRKEQIDRQRFCEKISMKFHENSIMKKAFYGWKNCLEMTWKNRNNSKIERQAQSVCKQLVTEYEKQIIELRSEITKLQDENASMHTSRSATQDAVKKALLRGVCALNMETMSILNQNGILIENDLGCNTNNNFSVSNIPGKCSKNDNDDKPRFPLYNKSILNGSENLSYFSISDSLHNHMEEIEINNTENSNIYSKDKKSQYCKNKFVQNHGNSHKKKSDSSDFSTENNSIPKVLISKNSAITVQAGNPTGSHTHSTNPLLNISIQKHTDNTVLTSHSIGHQLESISDKKYYKK